MTTTKSSSKTGSFPSVYRSCLRRAFPFGVFLAIILFLIIPTVYLAVNQVEVMSVLSARYRYFTNGVFFDNSQIVFMYMALGAVAFAMAIGMNSYMNSKRQVDFYHSLPVTRGRLLLGNFAAAMTAILVPLIAMTLLGFIAQQVRFSGYAYFDGAYYTFILIDLLRWITLAAVVYAFTTMIAVNVGTSLDAVAAAGVLGFAPLALYFIHVLFAESALYGMSGLYEDIFFLSPYTFIFQQRGYLNDSRDGGAYALYLLLWLAIGAVLLCLAILCYRRRKSEIAEQPRPSGIPQFLVKFTASFVGGFILYAVFYSGGSGAVGRIAAIALGGALAGLIAELILGRGLNHLKKDIKWLAIGVGAICLYAVAVTADLTGYVRRVPSPEQVTSVSIQYAGRFSGVSVYDAGYNPLKPDRPVYKDPEAIRAVTEMHRMNVDNYQIGNNTAISNYNGSPYSRYFYPVQIEYRLKSGVTMKRHYGYVYAPSMLILNRLETFEEFHRNNNPIFYTDPQYVQEVKLSDGAYTGTRVVDLSREQIQRLYEALREDYLSETQEELEANSSAAAYLELLYVQPASPENAISDDRRYYYSYSNEGNWCIVAVYPHYANTLALFGEWGLKKDTDTDYGTISGAYLIDNYYSNCLTSSVGTAEVLSYKTCSRTDYPFSRLDQAGMEPITDPSQIRQLVKLSFTRLYLDMDNNDQSSLESLGEDRHVELYLVRQGGEIVGPRIMSIKDLPAFGREYLDILKRREQSGGPMEAAAVLKDDAFTVEEAGAIGIIGGADGPTAIYVTND